jgi:hypothetical protein
LSTWWRRLVGCLIWVSRIWVHRIQVYDYWAVCCCYVCFIAR